MHVGYCKVKRSCFRAFEGKVLGIFVLMIRQFHRNESSWNVCSRGMKVSRERMFHGTWNFRSRGTKVPQKRKFHGTKVHGSESSLCGLFAPWKKCRGTKRPGIRFYPGTRFYPAPAGLPQLTLPFPLLPRDFKKFGSRSYGILLLPLPCNTLSRIQRRLRGGVPLLKLQLKV